MQGAGFRVWGALVVNAANDAMGEGRGDGPPPLDDLPSGEIGRCADEAPSGEGCAIPAEAPQEERRSEEEEEACDLLYRV